MSTLRLFAVLATAGSLAAGCHSDSHEHPSDAAIAADSSSPDGATQPDAAIAADAAITADAAQAADGGAADATTDAASGPSLGRLVGYWKLKSLTTGGDTPSTLTDEGTTHLVGGTVFSIGDGDAPDFTTRFGVVTDDVMTAEPTVAEGLSVELIDPETALLDGTMLTARLLFNGDSVFDIEVTGTTLTMTHNTAHALDQTGNDAPAELIFAKIDAPPATLDGEWNLLEMTVLTTMPANGTCISGGDSGTSFTQHATFGPSFKLNVDQTLSSYTDSECMFLSMATMGHFTGVSVATDSTLTLYMYDPMGNATATGQYSYAFADGELTLTRTTCMPSATCATIMPSSLRYGRP